MRLAPPAYVTMLEVVHHIKTSHYRQQPSVLQDQKAHIVFPSDLAKAKCRQCSQELISSDRQTIVKHLRYHNVDLSLVSPDLNVEFLLGCRICFFETGDWKAWREHFRSPEYLCRSAKIRKNEPRASGSSSCSSISSQLFDCNICREAFASVVQLQDHFFNPAHHRKMEAMPWLALHCQICRSFVHFQNFKEHIKSFDHRSALRDLVTGNKPKKVLEGRLPDLRVVVGDVQSRDRSDFGTSCSQPEHQKPFVRPAVAEKLHCPFCSALSLPDLEAHIHQVFYFSSLYCCPLFLVSC